MGSESSDDLPPGGEKNVQAFLMTMINRALKLVEILAQPGYAEGKSEEAILEEVYVRLGLEAPSSPSPFQSSSQRERAIQSSNAPSPQVEEGEAEDSQEEEPTLRRARRTEERPKDDDM